MTINGRNETRRQMLSLSKPIRGACLGVFCFFFCCLYYFFNFIPEVCSLLKYNLLHPFVYSLFTILFNIIFIEYRWRTLKEVIPMCNIDQPESLANNYTPCWKGVFMLTSKEHLGFYLALSQFMASTMNSIQHVLATLSPEALSYILQFIVSSILVSLIFRFQTKGQPSYVLGHMKVAPWIPPSILCIALTILLLL